MPYLGATASSRSTSAGVTGGGDERSVASWPTSAKNLSRPDGLTTISIVADSGPLFLKQCRPPFGKVTYAPAVAAMSRPSAWKPTSPSRT